LGGDGGYGSIFVRRATSGKDNESNKQGGKVFHVRSFGMCKSAIHRAHVGFEALAQQILTYKDVGNGDLVWKH
jgi:hypothetical protein